MINKNNKILVIVFVILGFILLSIIILSSLRVRRQPTTVPVIPPDSDIQKTYIPVKSDTAGLSSKVPNDIAQKEKDKLTNLLPIKVTDFKTSLGITTNTHIFSIASDPSQVIHIEIYGVNYYLSDAVKDNPHAIAFSETFSYIKKILLEKDINVNNLQVVYGNRAYIQNTAEYWIKAFNLLP